MFASLLLSSACYNTFVFCSLQTSHRCRHFAPRTTEAKATKTLASLWKQLSKHLDSAKIEEADITFHVCEQQGSQPIHTFTHDSDKSRTLAQVFELLPNKAPREDSCPSSRMPVRQSDFVHLHFSISTQASERLKALQTCTKPPACVQEPDAAAQMDLGLDSKRPTAKPSRGTGAAWRQKEVDRRKGERLLVGETHEQPQKPGMPCTLRTEKSEERAQTHEQPPWPSGAIPLPRPVLSARPLLTMVPPGERRPEWERHHGVGEASTDGYGRLALGEASTDGFGMGRGALSGSGISFLGHSSLSLSASYAPAPAPEQESAPAPASMGRSSFGGLKARLQLQRASGSDPDGAGAAQAGAQAGAPGKQDPAMLPRDDAAITAMPTEAACSAMDVAARCVPSLEDSGSRGVHASGSHAGDSQPGLALETAERLLLGEDERSTSSIASLAERSSHSARGEASGLRASASPARTPDLAGRCISFVNASRKHRGLAVRSPNIEATVEEHGIADARAAGEERRSDASAVSAASAGPFISVPAMPADSSAGPTAIRSSAADTPDMASAHPTAVEDLQEPLRKMAGVAGDNVADEACEDDAAAAAALEAALGDSDAEDEQDPGRLVHAEVQGHDMDAEVQGHDMEGRREVLRRRSRDARTMDERLGKDPDSEESERGPAAAAASAPSASQPIAENVAAASSDDEAKPVSELLCRWSRRDGRKLREIASCTPSMAPAAASFAKGSDEVAAAALSDVRCASSAPTAPLGVGNDMASPKPIAKHRRRDFAEQQPCSAYHAKRAPPSPIRDALDPELDRQLKAEGLEEFLRPFQGGC